MNSGNSVHPIVIVGGGSAGISVASSLLKRKAELGITIIDPASDHYYQPGFTMVGGGIFNIKETRRDMRSIIPGTVNWIQSAVSKFDPKEFSQQLY